MGAQLALICVVGAVALYWTLIRKKKKESADWVPAALVRQYLDKVRTDEADIRYRLFGEQAPVVGGVAPTIITSSDPAIAGQLDALRAQLGVADQRALDFDRMLNGLRAEKAALEAKLAAAPAAGAGGATAGAAGPAVQKELDDLKAKLQEYEVIEDDLANLKKFQKENETLRAKVDQYEKGGAVVAGTPAPAPAEVKISGGAPQQAPELKVVPAAPAPVAEAPKAPETNTNVLAPVTPTADPAPAAAAPAAEKSAKDKEAELLSEFEKMLAS